MFSFGLVQSVSVIVIASEVKESLAICWCTEAPDCCIAGSGYWFLYRVCQPGHLYYFFILRLRHSVTRFRWKPRWFWIRSTKSTRHWRRFFYVDRNLHLLREYIHIVLHMNRS